MITDKDIQDRIINNGALFNNIFVIQQKFDIAPEYAIESIITTIVIVSRRRSKL